MISIVVRETATNIFEEVPFGTSFVGNDGALHSWQVAELWTEDDLAQIGVYRVERVHPPAGYELVSQEYAREGNAVIAVGTFVELPYEPIEVYASSAKLVLDEDKIYDLVETICKEHPVNAVKIFWESASNWVEDDPYVRAIGCELDLNDEMMRAMFVRALAKDKPQLSA